MKVLGRSKIGNLLFGAVCLSVVGGEVIDSLGLFHKEFDYAKMLRSKTNAPLHINEGKYQLVFDEQFEKELNTFQDVEQKQVVGAFTCAVDEFNKLSSNIKFELLAESKNFEQYGVPQYSQGKKIPITITTKDMGSSIAYTYLHSNLTGQILDSSMEFAKKYMDCVWQISKDKNELYTPKNNIIYTVMEHETLHLLGFDDLYDKNRGYSIMRYDLSAATKEYTEFDKKALALYNYTFANGPKPVFEDEENKTSVPKNQCEFEL